MFIPLRENLYQTVVPVKLKFKKEVIQFFVGKFLIFQDNKQINCQVTLFWWYFSLCEGRYILLGGFSCSNLVLELQINHNICKIECKA